MVDVFYVCIVAALPVFGLRGSVSEIALRPLHVEPRGPEREAKARNGERQWRIDWPPTSLYSFLTLWIDRKELYQNIFAGTAA